MTDDLEDRIAALEAAVEALRYRLEWQENLSGMYGPSPIPPYIPGTPFGPNNEVSGFPVVIHGSGDPDGSAS